nr:retrovirus-related Pol polyprotein from transposon TNT 1-94 [Tanacetum cinerariifolium]
MTMHQVQVNTKFLNALPPEWSKFVTDVKLAKSSTSLRKTNLEFCWHWKQIKWYKLKGTSAAGQTRVVKCYKGEGHMARQCTQPKRLRNVAWFKEKLMLTEAQEADQILDEEQLAFLVYPRMEEDPVAQQIIPHNAVFQTEDLDFYDLNCDDLSSAKAVLMANLLCCDSDILSEETQDAGIQDTNSSAPNDLLILYLVKQMNDQVSNLERQNVDLNKREKLIDSQIDDLIRNKNAKLEAFKQEINTLKETLSNNVKEKESLSTAINIFKTESKGKESNVIAKENNVIFVIDDEDTLILEEESRSKMLEKEKDPILIEKKVNIAPINYSKLNNLKEDFVKSHTPVRVEAPSELPKCSIDKNDFELKIKKVQIDNDQLLNQIMSQEIVHIAMNSVDILDVNKSCADDCSKYLERETELSKRKISLKKIIENELKKLKGKNVFDTDVSRPSVTTIAPRMFKLNLEPLAPKLLQNKDTHVDYIKHSRDHADILREIVKNARALSPLDSNLDSTCKYVQRIQEVLDSVRETCPCLSKLSKKLVVVTPMNKDKKVRFADPLTSSCNTQIPTNSNKPMLHSTGVKCSTSASGSQSLGITKNDRISQPSCSNKTNKVEDHLRALSLERIKRIVLTKLNKPKADIGIFVGYAPAKKSFRIYNKGTRMIIETIHVDFDEFTAMASE